ncbi:MAG: 50S ribosomal protein L9 [Candidatus Hydrogenedentes bacterium]|nr:50S ribosomal protein L9 [Candidatus Hydrogenedentota bacterium]
MKVILCENVPNLGEMGTTVKVAPGYARNFLLPRKLAVPAESGSAKQIEHELRNIKRREEKVRVQLADEAKKLQSLTIEIKAKGGGEDRIFGSVTTVQIAEALKPLGYAVDKRSIHVDEPIRTLGTHVVSVKLMKGIEAKVNVVVVKDQEDIPVVSEAPAAGAPAKDAPAEEASAEVEEVVSEEESVSDEATE